MQRVNVVLGWDSNLGSQDVWLRWNHCTMTPLPHFEACLLSMVIYCLRRGCPFVNKD